MNLANLPFDSEAMLQGLRAWVECESPTWDAGAVNRMLDLAAREMAVMGASIERIAGRQGFGGCVRASLVICDWMGRTAANLWAQHAIPFLIELIASGRTTIITIAPRSPRWANPVRTAPGKNHGQSVTRVLRPYT